MASTQKLHARRFEEMQEAPTADSFSRMKQLGVLRCKRFIFHFTGT